MGRTKVFDETEALDLAMHLFWRQGYANTSIKQLLAEMDMLNGSFYHAFKDKKTIFLNVLAHYNEEYTFKRQEALMRHDDFSVGIRVLFSEIYKTLKSKDEPNGCLIVNSMVDEVLREEELKNYLYESSSQFIRIFAERIQHSIDLKFTHTTLPAMQLAYILGTYIFGLLRASVMIEVKQLESQTNDLLKALSL